MEKIIHKLINEFTQGVDTYTHNKSTWLIFTESKQWVIELTDSKTLWYNYNFFKGIFSYTSMDVVENQSYITKWVEDNIINKELTYATLFRDARDRKQQFEDALENGVRHTEDMVTNIFVDDTLENGVRHTDILESRRTDSVEDTLQNGVKETIFAIAGGTTFFEDALQNGVKKTKMAYMKTDWSVEDTIENGVKETHYKSLVTKDDIENAIQNGVKEIYEYKGFRTSDIRETIQNGVKDTQSNPYENESWINGIIKNGVKHTFPNSEMGTSDDVEDAIQNGIKEIKGTPGWTGTDKMISNVIDNGVKETHEDVYHHKGRIDGVIKNGVKETKISPTHTEYGDWLDGDERLDEIIKNGVKETVAAGYTDPKTNLLYVKWGDQIDDIIENGVKETKSDDFNLGQGMVDKVMSEGEKINGTYAGGQRQSEKSKSVVEYGTKNPTS